MPSLLVDVELHSQPNCPTLMNRNPHLLVLRHGEAVPNVLDDANRELTPAGARSIRELATVFSRSLGSPALIFTSPLKRSCQTAEQILKAWPNSKFEVTELLKPGFNRIELLRFLAPRWDESPLALVGHEPDLSALVAELVSATRRDVIKMETGTCCVLEMLGPTSGRIITLCSLALINSMHVS